MKNDSQMKFSYCNKVVSFLLFMFMVVNYTFGNNIVEQPLPKNCIINKVEVYKSKRQLLAFSNEKLIKTYTISLGGNPIGAKHFKGDDKTPEGSYLINDKNANSKYHKNLGISYPNKNDILFARKNKLEAGGDIKIHGLSNKWGSLNKVLQIKRVDWTKGCIALSNDEIDELFKAVKIGTPIIIYP